MSLNVSTAFLQGTQNYYRDEPTPMSPPRNPIMARSKDFFGMELHPLKGEYAQVGTCRIWVVSGSTQAYDMVGIHTSEYGCNVLCF